jgi:selenocysteine lyase/cysteine desulfurase
VETIALHNKNLSSALLLQLCDQVLTCPDVRRLGATLCLQYTPQACLAAAEKLRAVNAHFDRRGNTLRLSFHIYNTMEEAIMVANALND